MEKHFQYSGCSLSVKWHTEMVQFSSVANFKEDDLGELIDSSAYWIEGRRKQCRAVWKSTLAPNITHSIINSFAVSDTALVASKSAPHQQLPSTICSESPITLMPQLITAFDEVLQRSRYWGFTRIFETPHTLTAFQTYVRKINLCCRVVKNWTGFFYWKENKLLHPPNEYTFSSYFIIIIIIRVECRCGMARRDDTLLIKRRRRCKTRKGNETSVILTSIDRSLIWYCLWI